MEGTPQVKTNPAPNVVLDLVRESLISSSGALLLRESVRVAGLDRGLSAALAPWRSDRARHDPGKVLLDVAIAVALGGDCLADVAVVRAQPEVFGSVASDPSVSRLFATLAQTTTFPDPRRRRPDHPHRQTKTPPAPPRLAMEPPHRHRLGRTAHRLTNNPQSAPARNRRTGGTPSPVISHATAATAPASRSQQFTAPRDETSRLICRDGLSSGRAEAVLTLSGSEHGSAFPRAAAAFDDR